MNTVIILTAAGEIIACCNSEIAVCKYLQKHPHWLEKEMHFNDVLKILQDGNTNELSSRTKFHKLQLHF